MLGWPGVGLSEGVVTAEEAWSSLAEAALAELPSITCVSAGLILAVCLSISFTTVRRDPTVTASSGARTKPQPDRHNAVAIKLSFKPKLNLLCNRALGLVS